MIGIYQVIGKPESYHEKEFIIDGKSYESCLCSEALRKYLQEKGEVVELTIFVPESMLLDDDLESLCRKLNRKGVEDFKAAVIPSVGRYRHEDGEVEFRGNVEAIVSSIFIYFIETRPEKMFVDVSMGFNIYPVNLLEATKRYLTYRKMERILQSTSNVSAWAVFSPPVTKDVYRYNIEIQPVDVKAFFSLPNAGIDKVVRDCPKSLKNRLGKINREHDQLKKDFRLLFEDLRLAYNAIRLNVPLAFYELINVSNIFYSIAMFKSIKEFKKHLDEPEVNEILDKFLKLYRNKNLGVGVNEYFLLRDLEEIKESSIKLRDGEKELLGKLIYGEDFYMSRSSKRNFFAHSGFLHEYTLLKEDNGKILVSWRLCGAIIKMIYPVTTSHLFSAG